MEPIRKRIAISGYYGFQNSGDEAVLYTILTALREEGKKQSVNIEPVVFSADPSFTEKVYGVEAAPRMKIKSIFSVLRSCDGLISGGGSLLQDATGIKSIPYYLGMIQLAQWLNKPVFVYAQGIGPIHRRIFRPWIRKLYRRSSYLSVRDPRSAALLTHFGIPQNRIVIAADPVLKAPPVEKEAVVEDGPPAVGVAARFWKEDRSDLNGLADALIQLAAQKSIRIRLLAFHPPRDTDASRIVAERLERAGVADVEIAPAAPHPQHMLREVSRCRLLIGMRLHSLIYAASQGVPMIGISYDPKIDYFLQQTGMQAVCSTDALSPQNISAEAIRILDKKDHIDSVFTENVENLQQLASLPAQQIISILRNKDERK